MSAASNTPGYKLKELGSMDKAKEKINEYYEFCKGFSRKNQKKRFRVDRIQRKKNYSLFNVDIQRGRARKNLTVMTKSNIWDKFSYFNKEDKASERKGSKKEKGTF
ncbi:unnamed protein product [Oikopleura dioica]|uniref:Uncharacterized protein n=1 Tax=Oikopleura dioica TaxID=34765 RepID=E4XVY8_OIKDI|nr:unnamed protein product [Oikopleura dioica]CBY35116.1 unnamed protein product [Oikopleura dioica]